jgi:glucose dehydrogenase
MGSQRSISRVAAALFGAVAMGLAGAGHGGLNDGTANGEWRYWGGDEASSRYSPLEQINADNFADLEIAWRWKADNFGPEVDYILRATPLYVKGKLYAVAGQRRTVVSIDPKTGETLWMWRMKENPRWQKSTRKNYGKGVAWAERERPRRDLRDHARASISRRWTPKPGSRFPSSA